MRYNIQVKVFNGENKTPNRNFASVYTFSGEVTAKGVKDNVRETLNLPDDTPVEEKLYIGNKETKDTDVISSYETAMEYNVFIPVDKNVFSPNVKENSKGDRNRFDNTMKTK